MKKNVKRMMALAAAGILAAGALTGCGGGTVFVKDGERLHKFVRNK